MRATVRLDDSLASHVDAVRQDSETSDAEAVRECIRRSQRLDDAHDRIDDLEKEVERLKREKRIVLEERNEKQELARYAERRRTLEEQRAAAGLATRAKWWLFGMDDEGETAGSHG